MHERRVATHTLASSVSHGRHDLSARFELLRRLGAGGGGEVWLARERANGRESAIKLLGYALTDEQCAALERLLANVCALNDPHLLPVEQVGRSAGRPALVMPYASGGDLTVLRGQSAAEVLRVLVPIARGLERLHAAGIVHRDVKTTNVLRGADGTPYLADFESAAYVGQMPSHAAHGSPYSQSPQQLDGAPAAVADDVYAFGVMLYELLSGYPPFYPDITPERIRNEVPAPLNVRVRVSERIARLVARCLRKSPDERPASMASVATELEDAVDEGLAASGAASVERSMSTNESDSAMARPEPPVVRPPMAPAESLRSEWRRPTQAAPDPSEFRRQGFRRGLTVSAVVLAALALFIVFFALPKWVEQPQATYRQAASTPIEAPKAEAPKAPIDFAALARAKQEAEEVRTPLADRVEQLRERGVEQWGADGFKRVNDELGAGDTQFAAREYVLAVEHFRKAEPLLGELEMRATQVLKEQLAAGAKALQDGRSGDAKAAYELALKLEPKNAAATRGVQRAATLDQVLALLTSAQTAEKEGNVNQALADYREALALDKDEQRASEGIARVSARVAGDTFASAMAQGFAALGASNYAAARTAFEAANRIRPSSPEVASALKQVEQQERTRSIAAKLDVARSLESREQWADALKTYRDIQALDSTVAAANEGVARVQPRAALNEQLELYLTQPERLFSSPVRAAARETLQSAAAIRNPGPVLMDQTTKLKEWLARADVPVQVALQSDNFTQVTIFRVGALGAFEQRSLELAPGEYTVLGTRPGYRDVRRQITVVPGTAMAPIVIRCEDKI